MAEQDSLTSATPSAPAATPSSTPSSRPESTASALIHPSRTWLTAANQTSNLMIGGSQPRWMQGASNISPTSGRTPMPNKRRKTSDTTTLNSKAKEQTRQACPSAESPSTVIPSPALTSITTPEAHQEVSSPPAVVAPQEAPSVTEVYTESVFAPTVIDVDEDEDVDYQPLQIQSSVDEDVHHQPLQIQSFDEKHSIEPDQTTKTSADTATVSNGQKQDTEMLSTPLIQQNDGQTADSPSIPNGQSQNMEVLPIAVIRQIDVQIPSSPSVSSGQNQDAEMLSAALLQHDGVQTTGGLVQQRKRALEEDGAAVTGEEQVQNQPQPQYQPRHQMGNIRSNNQQAIDVMNKLIDDRTRDHCHGRDRNDSTMLRYMFLRNASAIGDAFYLLLHQLFCLWSIDQAIVCQVLSVVRADIIDQAFNVLSQILRPNASLPMDHLHWFTKFPSPVKPLADGNIFIPAIISSICRFVVAMASSWAKLKENMERRRYPLTAFEICHVLKCPSHGLQRCIFIMSRRILNIPDAVAANLDSWFTEDQINQSKVTVQDIGAPYSPQILGALSALKARYIKECNEAFHMERANQHMLQAQAASMPPASQEPTLRDKGNQIQIPRVSTPASASTPYSPSVQHMSSMQQTAMPRVNMVPNSNIVHRGSHQTAAGHSAPQVPTYHHHHQQQQQQLSGGNQLSHTRNLQPSILMMPTMHQMPLSTHPGASSFYPPATQPSPQMTHGQGFSWPHHPPPHNPPPHNQFMVFDSAQLVLQSQREPTSPGHVYAPRPSIYPVSYPSPLLHSPTYASGVNQATVRHSVTPVQPLPGQSPVLAQNLGPASQSNNAHSRAVSSAAPRAAPRIPINHNTGPLHPNLYPTCPYSWKSYEMAPHLPHLRSPRRLPARVETTGSRHYQFVDGFVAKPRLFPPKDGLTNYKFTLSSEDLKKVSKKFTGMTGLQTRAFSNGSRRYRLRICSQPTSKDGIAIAEWVVWPTDWPKEIYFSLNGKVLSLSRKQFFHHDLPLELSDYVVEGTNILKVSFPNVKANKLQGKSYSIGIEMVKTASHEAILKMLDTTGYHFVDATKSEIAKRLAPLNHGDDDLIIEDNSLRINLTDPFTSVMFNIPVRGLDCKHLECFDLETWLQTRPRRPIMDGSQEPIVVDCWRCPLCSHDARPSSLRVDDFLANVRSQLIAEGKQKATVIHVRADGSWWTTANESNDRESHTAQPQSRAPSAPVEIIDLSE